MSEVKGGIAARCKCGARLRLPETAAGRELACPKCRARLRVPAKVKPAPRKRRASSASQIKIRCECGAKLAFPASARGRRAKCPKCNAIVSVVTGVPQVEEDGLSALDALAEAEQSAPAIARSAAPAAADDGLPLHMAPAESTQRFNPADEVEHSEPRPTCPSCQQLLPPGAKICVQCGINIKSGRPLLMTDEEGLDRAYTYAETTIPAISWLVWFGIYPIASEAFGMAKPFVVRGIALVTIAVSLFVLGMGWFGPDGDRPYGHLMLWCGSRSATVDRVMGESEYWYEDDYDYEYDYGDTSLVDAEEEVLEPEEQEVVIGEAVDELYAEMFGWDGEFRGYQLLTHALLHADLLHLIGNMLFFMVFGARINALIGNLWTVGLYPLFAIAAGVIFRMTMTDEPLTPMLGASGAVMAMAGMYIVLFPVHKVHMAIWLRWGLLAGFRLSMSLFAVRGFWVVLFYIAFDVVYTSLGVDTGVAHWAHLGGFISGVVVAFVLLFTRLVNARGGDILSAVLGRHAWALIGRPHRAVE